MTAVPANIEVGMVVQDKQGFRSNVRITGFNPDLSVDGNTLSSQLGNYLALAAAVQAMTNAKIVKISFGYSFDYAQEPSSESGTYELVIQKAKLRGGDGMGGFSATEIPAPKDGLFLTSGQDNLIVVNPSSALLTTATTGFLATAQSLPSPRGGSQFQQFFGGQLVQGKPRRRRVVQGA